MKLMARQISRMMYDPKEFAEWQEVKETMIYFPSGRKECFIFKTNDGREIAVKARFCEVCYVF